MRRLLIGLAATAVFSMVSTPSFAGGLEFDGVDDFVQIGDPISLTEALTVEAWVLVESITNAPRIVSNRGSNSGFDIDISGLKDPVMRLAFNGNFVGQVAFADHLNSWTHVAVVWEGTGTNNVIFFINGVESGRTLSGTAPNPTAQNMTIGSMSSSFFFDGKIDDVRVWSVPVGSTEIAGWMNREVDSSHPNYEGLEGAWNFEEGTGQTAASDVGDPSRNGTLGLTTDVFTDDPTWVDGSPTSVEQLSIGNIKTRFWEPRP